MTIINIKSSHIQNLDLSPAIKVIEPILAEAKILDYEQQINFKIDYPTEPEDPRELSEIPEIRLWFLRLDAYYPWLPFFLNWKSGELARYTAMLVPHQFHRTEGIQYNPEALEIFVMQKIFCVAHWLAPQEIPLKFRLKSMAQTQGYEIDDSWFDLLGGNT